MLGSEEEKKTEGSPDHYRKMILRGWLIVCGIAAAFILYGLFAFFVIGDKQPADWDFGQIEDTPGESMYSTFPYRGRTEQPRSQHVDQKPPNAEIAISDNPPPPGGTEERGFQETGGRGSDQMPRSGKMEPTSGSK